MSATVKVTVHDPHLALSLQMRLPLCVSWKADREGFTVVPVRHRHRRLFGGGFHCFTLDTVRDGPVENYLT
jgi:N-dimethylarginine dimethylaminohydrolase